MYEKQSKNILILDILQILEKYSDVNHKLTQKDIIALLKSEYDMDVERKSILRNINNLIEAGYEISYDERIVKNKAFKDFNIPKHMIEHIYMMSGDSEVVTFEFDKKTLINVIDWFGNDIVINKAKVEDTFVATAKVNINAMRFWAMQYGENVTVKSPKSLVNRIKEQLNNMNKRYN